MWPEMERTCVSVALSDFAASISSCSDGPAAATAATTMASVVAMVG